MKVFHCANFDVVIPGRSSGTRIAETPRAPWRPGQPALDLAGERHLGVGDRDQDRLDRRQPQGQRSGVMLKQNTNEAFQRTQNGTVQHDRHMFAAIFGNVARTETVRHGKIQLDGTQLPDAVQTVFEGEFNFRTIESGAFAIGQAIGIMRKN